MFDIWWGDINLGIWVPVLSGFILLPLQVLLCLRVKSWFLRLFPVGFLGVSGGWFFFLYLYVPGWDSLGYGIFAIGAAIMLFMCALGWGIWGLSLWHRKRHEKG